VFGEGCAAALNLSDAEHAALQLAYDRVKGFPERDPRGFIRLIELRNLVGEALKHAPRPKAD